MTHEIRNKIFNIIHNHPIEKYTMWTILILTILICLGKLFWPNSYNQETYQFIKKL